VADESGSTPCSDVCPLGTITTHKLAVRLKFSIPDWPARALLGKLGARLKVVRPRHPYTVNKLIKNLVEAGLVRLEAVPGKRNTKWIVITDSGREIIFDVVTELNRMEALLEKRVGRQLVGALRTALEADWGPTEPK
jgi:Mn-dependent DtxR family transcriptional regulator